MTRLGWGLDLDVLFVLPGVPAGVRYMCDWPTYITSKWAMGNRTLTSVFIPVFNSARLVLER